MDLYQVTTSIGGMVQDQTVGLYNWRYMRLLNFELGAPKTEHNGCSYVTHYDRPFHFVFADKICGKRCHALID